MTNSVANIVISRMRLDGVTVKGWAEANRYRPDTVYKTIHGLRGKTDRGESAKIREHLKSDGYWPDDKELVRK